MWYKQVKIKIKGKYCRVFFTLNFNLKDAHYVLMYCLTYCQKRGSFSRLIQVPVKNILIQLSFSVVVLITIPVTEYSQLSRYKTVFCSQVDLV